MTAAPMKGDLMQYVFVSFALALSLIPLSGDGAGMVDEKPEEHCVVFVLDQAKDGELIMSDPDCFKSEPDAAVWALVGYSAVRPGSRSTGAVLPLSSMTLGKHYDGYNGTGSSITIVGSSCTGGHWNTGWSWRNRISSSYNGCARLRHYDLPNKAGQAQDTYGAGTTDNLGSLNNKAESISYHSS